MSLEANKAVVRRAVELLDTYDLRAFEEVCSPELAQEWRDMMTRLPFSDHHLEITDLVAEGDLVAVRLATRGTHSGEWKGIPPTGKAWTNRGMAMARLAEGRIVEFDSVYDDLDHVQQLGGTILPPVPEEE
jgi:ketosteroid isomerase-like protein